VQLCIGWKRRGIWAVVSFFSNAKKKNNKVAAIKKPRKQKEKISQLSKFMATCVITCKVSWAHLHWDGEKIKHVLGGYFITNRSRVHDWKC
jgi:hypothetical protein